METPPSFFFIHILYINMIIYPHIHCKHYFVHTLKQPRLGSMGLSVLISEIYSFFILYLKNTDVAKIEPWAIGQKDLHLSKKFIIFK